MALLRALGARLWRVAADGAAQTHTQLSRCGAVETLSTSASSWEQAQALAAAPATGRTAPAKANAKANATNADTTTSPEEFTDPSPPLRFVSSERRVQPQLPRRRIPICFPKLSLQMLKLPEDQLQQIKERGWLREVAFKTTPDVTKLEIWAFLESVYGMSVERVNTINYLGRRRLTVNTRNGKRLWWREDDWKKAYVTFRPPPGKEHWLQDDASGAAARAGIAAEGQRSGAERIREAARAPKPPSKPWPWEEGVADKRRERREHLGLPPPPEAK